jgi:signal transduction histidine kinase
VGSRWRIRHKLLLGLALVVGVMALLLSGTLRGLWSYYLTTNSIRGKLGELIAAEEFKAAVTALVAPEKIARFLDRPDELPQEMKAARARLEAYQEKLQETLEHSSDPGRGEHETGVIEKLHSYLDEFEKAVERTARPRADGEPDTQRLESALKELKQPSEQLTRQADDLRDDIKRVLADRLGQSRTHYQAALWIIVPSSVIGLLVMAGLMRSFYAWVFNPIRDLSLGVARVAQGDFEHKIELHSGDEMEDLGNAFNDMMGRLRDVYADLARQVNERSRQLVRSERLASVGFLAAGVAHEINNPLASIAFCSEALEARLAELLRPLRATTRGGEEQEVFARYLEMIHKEAFRCKKITERLLAFSRSGERKREPTDLRALVQSVVEMAQHLQDHKSKQIVFEVSTNRAGDPDAAISPWVNAEEIKSVVLNLVVNALDSMDEGGRLTIRLAQRDGSAELRFTDTGCGMTQEVLENIFEPFFTRSRTGKGTGLGLTITHQIVNQHGGEIEASSAGPGRGSTFTVRLPLVPREAPADGAPRPETRPARKAA